MKIPPKLKKLDASDLAAYTAGRPGNVSHKPFKVDAGSLGSGPQKADLGTLDPNPFKTGGAGRATLGPLDFTAAGRQGTPAGSQHDQLVDKTQKWVAQTFFGTLMKQMSDSPFKSDLFSGGRGGEAFSSLYHQQLVDRMSHAAGSKLVNGIVRKIEAKQGKEAEAASRVQGSEKKSSARPSSDQDPRTKAYERSKPSRGRQSTFNLAA